MLTRKQAKEQCAKLMKEIARDERRTQRAALLELVRQRREAFHAKRGKITEGSAMFAHTTNS